eukprot:gene41496-50637_t
MSSSNAVNENTGSQPRSVDPNSLYKPISSSLTLQMLVYFSYHYTPFFFIVNICLFTFKAVRYYYPGRFLGWELTTIFLFLFIDEVRLLMLSKGNKTNNFAAFLSSLLLAIPMIILHAYYIALQTYVLRVDVVLNAVALVFLGLQTLLSVLALMNVVVTNRRI